MSKFINVESASLNVSREKFVGDALGNRNILRSIPSNAAEPFAASAQGSSRVLRFEAVSR
jgi:hypothetical protein